MQKFATSQLSLRLAHDDDGSEIGRLIGVVFAEYPGCLFADIEFPELTAIAAHYQRLNGRIWVVERQKSKINEGSNLIACCAVFRTRREGCFELSKFYLDKAYRGSGLAQELVCLARTFVRERDGKRLELFSDTRFHRAHHFYRKLGFRQLPGERYLADVSHSWEYHFVDIL